MPQFVKNQAYDITESTTSRKQFHNGSKETPRGKYLIKQLKIKWKYLSSLIKGLFSTKHFFDGNILKYFYHYRSGFHFGCKVFSYNQTRFA